MPESSLRFRLVIARASDSTPGDVSGIVTRLHTDTELFWLLSIARPVAATPKVCRRSVATGLALLMLDDHLRVLRVLPMASVPHTPGRTLRTLRWSSRDRKSTRLNSSH